MSEGTSRRRLDDGMSPEATRRRRRFWIAWVIVNVALTLVVVPAVFLLLGDVIVQLSNGSGTTRIQAGAGVYMLGVAATFCTLLPINLVAGVLASIASTGRKARAAQV